MLVTDKFVFVHDPKQGGSFVSSALFQIHKAKWNNLKHLQAAIFKKITVKSKYGEFIILAPALKHAGCRQIPQEYGNRKILSTIRNPFDWYVSQYEFGWWKKPLMFKYFEKVPGFKKDFPNFPDLSFEEFLRLSQKAFTIDFDCPPENLSRLGWRTRAFVKFYFKNPDEALTDLLNPDYAASKKYVGDMYPDIHFISTKNLNQNLYNFLRENNYEDADIDFILTKKKVLPNGKGRSEGQKWEKYFTPELRRQIRRKDRFLFEIFPEFDV